MAYINCASTTFDTYRPSESNPWNAQKAMHVYRRLTFGASAQKIQAATQDDPVNLVERIISDAADLPLRSKPYWGDWTIQDYDSNEGARTEQVISQIVTFSVEWSEDMLKNGLRDRMSWFWHNHFVTRLESYNCPSWMYGYHKLLQEYALGNFKEFVYQMGITPAMLIFLNNIQNTKFDPNENYARELFELFTLGVDNGYTQKDIVETARAISGWNGLQPELYCGEVTFIPQFWDDGEKTIFGRTGEWKYNDVIDILFEERGTEIAEFICNKLYTNFVNPIPDDQIISDLSKVFVESNFEIAPVLVRLFTSEHFFDEKHIGTIIPGHLEYQLIFMNELNLPPNKNILQYVVYSADEFNQRMFNPIDVAGWKGNRTWINSSTLPYRWQGIENLLGYYYQYQGDSLEQARSLAIAVCGVEENDPSIVTRKIIDFILPKGLQHKEEYEEAVAVFKGEIPENYFTSGQWNLRWDYVPAQVFFLLVHLANVPEFQLK